MIFYGCFLYFLKLYVVLTCILVSITVFVGGDDQRVATIERTISNACYTIGNGEIGQGCATIERITSNACYTIGNGDIGQ